MDCCLRMCNHDTLDTNHHARVEVKCALPKGGISKYKASFYVNWKRNGEATFHRECWEQLLHVSTTRKRRLMKDKHLSNDFLLLMPSKCEKEMILSASETAEMFDDRDSVAKTAAKIAKMITSSNHCVIFTGAGISTSAGLGDFRGKGGKWTEQDREAINISEPFPQEGKEIGNFENPSSSKRLKLPYNARTISDPAISKPTEQPEDEEDNAEEEIAYEALRPTYTHEAIQYLVEAGYVKYIVSQNCDGLHLLSGVSPSKISELHGNVFVEICERCRTRYHRQFYVCDDVADIYLEELEDYGKTDVIPPKFMLKCSKCGLSHRTGRMCEKQGCSGHLMDTIINFRDDLEEEILDKAFASAKSCDLLICLGTTLTVTPAAGIVDLIKRPKRVVICNRQATERDSVCFKKDKEGRQLGERVYADCDILMRHLMSNLLGENINGFESSLGAKKAQYNTLRNAE